MYKRQGYIVYIRRWDGDRDFYHDPTDTFTSAAEARQVAQKCVRILEQLRLVREASYGLVMSS